MVEISAVVASNISMSKKNIRERLEEERKEKERERGRVSGSTIELHIESDVFFASDLPLPGSVGTRTVVSASGTEFSSRSGGRGRYGGGRGSRCGCRFGLGLVQQ